MVPRMRNGQPVVPQSAHHVYVDCVYIFTFVAAGEPERHQRPDHAERLDGQQRVHFAGVRIGPQQFETLAARDQHLLGLGAREAAVHRVRDGRRPLQRQIVQIHLRVWVVRLLHIVRSI